MKDIEKNNTEAQKPFFYDLLSGGHGHKDAIYDKIADGIRLTIKPDGFVESPRGDRENLWCFSFTHKAYDLGDDKYRLNPNDYKSWKEYGTALQEEFGALELRPISMYEHSGVCLSVGAPTDRFDSGYVGFAFVTRETLEEAGLTLDELGSDSIETDLKGELELYNAYLNGESYEILTTEVSTGESEFVGGFLGSDFVENGLVYEVPDFFLEDVVKSLPGYVSIDIDTIKNATYGNRVDHEPLSEEQVELSVESQTFDVVHFIGDVLDNALSTAASQAGLDQYSFSDEFIDLISGEIQCSGEYSGKSFFEDLAYGGCVSGMIGGLVYYSETKEMYINHMDDIERVISDLQEDLGQPIGLTDPRYNSAVWLVFEEYSRRINDYFDFNTELEEEAHELSLGQKIALHNHLEDDDQKEIVIEQLEEEFKELNLKEKAKAFDLFDYSYQAVNVAHWVLDDLEEMEYTIERLFEEMPELGANLQAMDVDIRIWLNEKEGVDVAPEVKNVVLHEGEKKVRTIHPKMTKGPRL